MKKSGKIPFLIFIKRGVMGGLLFGFACGYLYGVGGFVFDFFRSGINHGSWLALNALWGMPLLFAILGAAFALVCFLLVYFAKKLSTARR